MTTASPPKATPPPAPARETVPKRTVFSKQGMGYLLQVPDASVSIRLNRIRRRSEEITGDVTVRARITGVKTVDGVLHISRINIHSGAAREKLAKLLMARSPGVDMDWQIWLDELGQKVVETLAAGEPIAEIGHDEIDWAKPKYAITPLVPLNEPTLLYGPGGGGKSMLALTMAIGTAAGRQLIPGTEQHLKGNVLYLDWETGRQKINRRIVTLCKGFQIDVPHGLFYRRQNRPLAEDVEELTVFIEEKKIVLVIIDSAAQAIGHQNEFGDANEGALRLFEGIRILGDISAVIVDHVSKQEMVMAGKRGRVPYGSVYKINYSRAAWEVRPAEHGQAGDPLRVVLHDFKRNDDAEHPAIGLEFDFGEQTACLRPYDPASLEPEKPVKEVTQAGTLGDMIAELLADGARMLPEDIATTLDQKGGSVRTTLYRDRRFERDGKGFWILAREHLPL